MQVISITNVSFDTPLGLQLEPSEQFTPQELYVTRRNNRQHTGTTQLNASHDHPSTGTPRTRLHRVPSSTSSNAVASAVCYGFSFEPIAGKQRVEQIFAVCPDRS
jgi:hypothetical protein